MATYTAPPDPIYRAAKKKEKVTKAIILMEGLKQELANHPVFRRIFKPTTPMENKSPIREAFN